MFNSRNLLVGLVAASVSFDVGNWSGIIANAAPDPIFNPILQNIRNQIPRGMMMRLPSNLRVYDYKGQRMVVYPDVDTERNRSGLSVILYSQPNCGGGRGSRSCFFGRLSVSATLTDFERDLVSNPISNRTQHGYPNRICGIVTRRDLFLNTLVKAISVDYDTCGVSSGRSNYIIWKQDGYFFLVTAGSENTNIDIATSMANEPPIYDSSTTRQDSTSPSTSSIPKGFRHGCGTGCSVDVTFTSPVQEIQTADNRSIRFASIRIDFRGAGRGGESGSSNSYIFAECSANKLAGGTSATPPSASDKWTKLSGDQMDYTTASAYRGGYFDALCIGTVRSYYNYSSTIPSVPPSSTPVKPTDTIAKYPTNDDFNAFENKLRGNPESLVKLRGNQAEQLRKFQNEWKDRNPNAAKFLGAWYTGDRYFYVFPSTAKGGTCVVTQDANGTLDMKIGVVLNQELRYDGGKGFFWRDHPNIIASRDSGSGSLYPIYATFGMPELPENMIGDMERQKCITTLPTDPVAAKPSPQRTDGQILTSENVGCTKDLKTALGQKAPDYCTSSEANSGILLDEFKAEKNKDNSINVKLRVFNRGTADGIVEIYDSRNRLQGTKIIDGNRPPTGLIQSGTDLFTKVPSSLFSRYPLGDARRDLKEQSIDFTIPSRGYAQITKSSNFALWYNTAMIALEISQLAGGDPEFVNSETVKQLVRGFAAEFAKSSVINIFKGEVSLQSIMSLDFVDKNKLSEVLQKLLQYSVTMEKDPSKNPILGAFSEVYQTAGNVGLERILDMYVLPGLGTLAKSVRVGGEVVNIAAKSIDTSNAKNSGQKATIILRNLQ